MVLYAQKNSTKSQMIIFHQFFDAGDWYLHSFLHRSDCHWSQRQWNPRLTIGCNNSLHKASKTTMESTQWNRLHVRWKTWYRRYQNDRNTESCYTCQWHCHTLHRGYLQMMSHSKGREGLRLVWQYVTYGVGRLGVVTSLFYSHCWQVLSMQGWLRCSRLLVYRTVSL